MKTINKLINKNSKYEMKIDIKYRYKKWEIINLEGLEN